MPSVLHCSRNVLVLFGLASEIQKAHFLKPVNKWKDKPITMHVPMLCDWFGSSASASDSLDHKLYASDYDSDSIASENQP